MTNLPLSRLWVGRASPSSSFDLWSIAPRAYLLVFACDFASILSPRIHQDDSARRYIDLTRTHPLVNIILPYLRGETSDRLSFSAPLLGFCQTLRRIVDHLIFINFLIYITVNIWHMAVWECQLQGKCCVCVTHGEICIGFSSKCVLFRIFSIFQFVPRRFWVLVNLAFRSRILN